MRQDEHLRVLVESVANGRECGANARVARDRSALDRDVEIFPDEDPLVAQVRIRHPQNFHDTFDHAMVVSSMRFEKPHSLSYQEKTFTSVPSMTFVSVPSKIDEWGSWLKSLDTSGSSVYARTPLRGPELAAARISLLTSSTEVARFAVKVRSTSDTLMVGTRMERPSSLPFNSGITSPTAAAAPVLVGICDIVAERARRRSLWNTFVSTWSLVYEWMVVITPETSPMLSWSTLATGARQLVVQEAFEMTV